MSVVSNDTHWEHTLTRTARADGVITPVAVRDFAEIYEREYQ